MTTEPESIPRPTRARLPGVGDPVPVGPLRFSTICLGTVREPEVVQAAFDRGITTFFVSADLHFMAYEALRAGLERLFTSNITRDQVVVISASYASTLDFMRAAWFESSFDLPAAIGEPDVVVVGGVREPDFFDRLAQTSGSSIVRAPGPAAFGASFHHRSTARLAVRSRMVDVAFVRYNPLHPGARHDLFPELATDSHVPVFNFLSTQGYVSDAQWEAAALPTSMWRPAYGDYYRYALSHPGLAGLLCAPQTIDELDHLCEAIDAGPLSQAECEYLEDLSILLARKQYAAGQSS